MKKSVRLRATRVVPDFRGLNFFAALTVDRQAEVKPADPNPDTPPLSAYWWQHQEFSVSTQDPEPGVEVYQWDSVKVTLAPPEAPAGAFVRRIPPPPLGAVADPIEPSTNGEQQRLSTLLVRQIDKFCVRFTELLSLNALLQSSLEFLCYSGARGTRQVPDTCASSIRAGYSTCSGSIAVLRDGFAALTCSISQELLGDWGGVELFERWDVRGADDCGRSRTGHYGTPERANGSFYSGRVRDCYYRYR